MSLENIKVGIMGGTGLDDPELLKDRVEKKVDTPFGSPSDNLILGTIEGISCVLLARHGRKHVIAPTNVNYRANLYALKQEGCTHVLVTTACGSLREEMQPGDVVILDSFIDRTFKRPSTFYDGTCDEFKGVCHIPMFPAFCESTRQILIDACAALDLKHHKAGVMVTIEGPRFSSQAESHMFRQWGGSTINMTTCPEVYLAKELGLCYSSIALATDYDCWRDQSEAVSLEMVLKTMKSNSEKALKLLLYTIPRLASSDWRLAAKKALATAKDAVMT
ncbi:S-methyl-5'-thioadenosine phosphorylase-like [Watersipora subatra]|uniref:S-methyl-5'-thioadenosine phosphorylase-like n=1 Tax=Watersipora subatra TaxID=2589382 RepID=UPI00355C215A